MLPRGLKVGSKVVGGGGGGGQHERAEGAQ